MSDSDVQAFFGESVLPADANASSYLTLAAADKAGTFIRRDYEKPPSKGFASPVENPDAVYWIASCTKLLTSIAVLQNVDKGLLQLDKDISSILPEWKAPMILKGFSNSDEPILKPAKNCITLRHLLTHTSGMGYPFFNPLIGKFQSALGNGPFFRDTIADTFPTILLREPGSRWEYSPALEWAGQMVERVNGMKLGEYFQRNIFDPLGIKNITFHLTDDMRARLVPTWFRSNGGLVPGQFPIPDPIKDAFGGGGLYSTATDFLTVLHSLLQDDCPLLSKRGIDSLFTPQIDSDMLSKYAVHEADPRSRAVVLGSLPPDTKISWGFGGLVTISDTPSGRKSHSLHWSGMPNCFWWVDRQSEICGLLLAQVLPAGDKQTVDLLTAFEDLVYSMNTGHSSSERPL
ncbi:beta-lactamase/transpeptidase-like protein [Aspergillus avenaceus]|uniref:Beta-lactamase/transpeptidase-like protein n=1 Tax=Aspergillus avenaceus TaxID=36643 RepID=A0A5N6U9I6_ASPAV|nr:beta-lactamase/transpeptidase-like protein [Aspergillus avenaceus]